LCYFFNYINKRIHINSGWKLVVIICNEYKKTLCLLLSYRSIFCTISYKSLCLLEGFYIYYMLKYTSSMQILWSYLFLYKTYQKRLFFLSFTKYKVLLILVYIHPRLPLSYCSQWISTSNTLVYWLM